MITSTSGESWWGLPDWRGDRDGWVGGWDSGGPGKIGAGQGPGRVIEGPCRGNTVPGTLRETTRPAYPRGCGCAHRCRVGGGIADQAGDGMTSASRPESHTGDPGQAGRSTQHLEHGDRVPPTTKTRPVTRQTAEPSHTTYGEIASGSDPRWAAAVRIIAMSSVIQGQRGVGADRGTRPPHPTRTAPVPRAR